MDLIDICLFEVFVTDDYLTKHKEKDVLFLCSVINDV
jgi:hypothetical protein